MGIAANTVKTFSNQDLTLIPYGDDLPSRKNGDVFADLSGRIYLMESGKRRLVPDWDTLRALGINVTYFPMFPESDIKDIELGDPYAPPIPQWQKDIDNTYQYTRNLLGNPTGSYWQAGSSPNGTQGYGQNYDNGTIYWTAQSGAIALWHGFANTYNENGGYSGWLGFPTKGKETDSSGGQRIDFEGGYIYWTAQDGAKAYRPWETPQQNLNNTVGYDGANTHQTYVDTFNNHGGSSALGSPTGNVYRSVDNGYLQEFSGGSEGSGAIMKSGANDNSYWVGGGFWRAYQKIIEQKDLGYPTSDRFVDQNNGLLTQTFQKGKIVYDGGVYKVPLSSGDSGGGNSKLPQSAAEAQAFFKNQFHQDPGLAAPPSNNCGPASLAIVLKALGLEPNGIGEQASINRAAELMGLNPTNHPNASDVDIERGIQNAGGTWIDVGIGSTDQRWNTLNEALANQNPVIAFGNANPEWWSQIGYDNGRSVNHVIAILGRTSNGNYIVADPLSSRAVEVSQTTLSKFFSIHSNAPAGRAFVLPTSNPGNGVNSSNNGNGSEVTATYLNAKIKAFLDTIAYAEGTKNPDGYRTIYSYQYFNDFSDHPRRVICAGGYCSNAAGRYQFLSSTWDGVKAKLGLKDFSPESQDLGAVELIKQRGAFSDIENGNLQAAIEKCSWEWASLPPGRYGQPQRSMAELLQVYQDSLTKYT
ncbi:glycoside hydrolase family protein [Tychonema sp. LEGE 07203]|uniref:C39 family peptidase n=1 Tax=Tychonema sp. LEGE 07203 TaxID=1828671 RepID=UPI00187FFF6F|nr:glycoside hydrolase family protein [Tychonema sp. LEGE 07203]MBE9097258.1 C39 family peptidase [Tychonema sp. LEGE 07203]